MKTFSFPRLLRIFRWALPEWKPLTLGFLALIMSSAMVLVYPQAVRYLIDEVLGKGRFQLLKPIVGIVFGVFVLQAVSAAFRYSIFTAAGERIVSRLRLALYRQILKQDIAFFDKHPTAELLSRLTADATVIQGAVTFHLSAFLQNLALVCGGLILLMRTSSIMTLGFLFAIPLTVLGTGFFGKRIQRFARDGQDAWGTTACIASETIAGIRTVRAFIQEASEEQRFADAVAVALQLGRLRIQNIAYFIGLASMLGSLTLTGVLWYGGQLVMSGRLTIGDLTSFLLYTLAVTVALGSLGSLWTDFMATVGASERVFALLDRQASIPLAVGLRPQALPGRIQFQHVHFRYPTRAHVEVLHDVNFTIEPGQTLALVGPSGGGKSTIAALLSRLHDPDRGAILIDGRNIKSLDGVWLRQNTGIVAQDPFLMSASIAANIRYGRPEATAAEIREAARAANALDFIEALPAGYDTPVGERGLQLSVGQRQRLAMARALLKNPALLILDEATSALDAESEFLVQEALERLMRGRTTLIIAHRLSTVRRADRVLVIDRGRIRQAGSHATLMQNEDGLYYRFARRQLSVL